MTRFAVTWGLAALGVAAGAGPASAQFISARSPLGGPLYSVYNYQSVYLRGYNPNIGPVTIGWAAAGGTVFRPGNLGVAGAGFAYAPANGYLNAGVPAGGQNPVFQQQRNAISRAQKGGKAFNTGFEARAAIADQWAYERGGKPAAAAGIPAGVNKGLLAAGPETIASGAALNDLLAAVGPMEAKAIRAVDSALVPPDLAARVVFAGGPTADAVNLLRAGTLDFPPPLLGPEFEGIRASLGRAFAAVTEATGHNRATVVAAADKLAAAVALTRDRVAPDVRDLPFHEATGVARFLNRVDGVAQTLKNPDAAGAFVPNWGAVGVTLKELTRHMARFGLTFAPAGPADADAYDTLHRGLADYYVGLARAGK